MSDIRHKVPKGDALRKIQLQPRSFYRGCVGKLRFKSKRRAAAFARKNGNGKVMHSYKCTFCNGWHSAKTTYQGEVLKEYEIAELAFHQLLTCYPEESIRLKNEFKEGKLTYDHWKQTMPANMIERWRVIGIDPEIIARETYSIFIERSGVHPEGGGQA